MGNHLTSCFHQGKTINTKSKLHDLPTDSSLPQRSNSISVDPKSLQFVQEKNRLLIRNAGSTKGHDFIIEECDDCRIYILDVTAQVTIDDCKNCSIFLSPCESSVSIRNCENCEIITLCSQLRLADCKNLDIMLFCATNPSIETSSDISFFGYQFAYFSLLRQMEDANLSVFNNAWFKVHDFDQEEPSKFSVKCNNVISKDVFPFIFSFILNDSIPEEILAELNPMDELIIPHTNGPVAVRDDDVEMVHPECLLWIVADREEVALTAFHEIWGKMDRLSILVDTKLVSWDDDVVDAINLERSGMESKACVCVHCYIAESVMEEVRQCSNTNYKVKVLSAGLAGNEDNVGIEEVKHRVFGE